MEYTQIERFLMNSGFEWNGDEEISFFRKTLDTNNNLFFEIYFINNKLVSYCISEWYNDEPITISSLEEAKEIEYYFKWIKLLKTYFK